ncbi:hypothetical protein [Nostoc punctiforme]|uniref:Uncharacterized protein n=1 Tax=Nostoc punctiforme (strain ATCC 29133 / PCC 73102) TaxID=63737 RepID=B2IYC0_NOSP7|nr:hypothetical protein [Nostoc punctiforme]ACC84719.1 hypothetical protein Npun_F6451 [Nostoc punctiforme PCC 73102]
MADNRIQVTLTARDLLSPQLGQIRSNIEALGASANIRVGLSDIRNLGQADLTRLRTQMDSLKPPDSSQGFMGAALFGNLGASAITQGIQMVTQGIQASIGAIQSAARTQINDLALAGNLATQLGVNFGKAKGLVADTSIEISKMAEALPGENADYNAIFSQISATVAGNAKGDVGKFKEESMELTKRFGVLSSIRGLDANQSGSAINRALAGTMGLSEVFQIDIFQKYPMLQSSVRDQLKAIGKSTEDWKSLSNDMRSKILLTGAKGAVSDDTVASFSGTVDSMIAEAKSSLFDERRGIFGFLRTLGSMGGRSTLDSVQGAMQSFKALLESLGSIKGFSVDPMEGVISVMDWFSDLAGSVNGVLNGENSSTITSFLTNTTTGFFEGFNNLVNLGLKGISNTNWGNLGKQVGVYIGDGFTKIFTRTDWGAISQILVKSLQGLGDFTLNFIMGAVEGNFKELGNAFNRVKDAVMTWANDTLKVFNKPGELLENLKTRPLAAIGDTLKSVGGRLNPLGDNGVVGALKNGGGFIGGMLNSNPITPLNPNSSNSPIIPLEIPKPPDNNKQAFVAPHVIINGTHMQNPQEIANAVMGAINEAYGKFKEGSLA